MLSVGDPAPDIEIQLIDGSTIRLSQLRGRSVVLYFYPKAFTPGCTREAIGFNGLYEEFKKLGAEVIGVSMDPPGRNRRFAQNYGVRFRLASDVEGEAFKSFWGAQRPRTD
ncbi:truncated thiol peroxidase [Aeropyrum pernix K1]|uniref:thioredoxin-dependent peroxiredoxin n=1 Tax=Aeropyrum pernix (strain ATCC 700893 / DSM 11879 / JCM 9820 / NBRC 100138 / K1) TaxID=272557 RepID=Q9YFF0_AERPE|nr:peroxiredoxin [Aeropyrum pernix]BAA79246.1 truncated thiol peroxidase [Aeropyrum pernix K1]